MYEANHSLFNKLCALIHGKKQLFIIFSAFCGLDFFTAPFLEYYFNCVHAHACFKLNVGADVAAVLDNGIFAVCFN